MTTEIEILKRLNYDKTSGVFTWAESVNRKIKVGGVAGSVDRDGYARIQIGGKPYRAHRLAWLFSTGKFPIGEIDHIDGNRKNNRIENLRLANGMNNQNRRSPQRNGTSGFLGVTKDKKSGKWVAQIGHEKRQRYLGLYKTPEEAYSVYVKEKRIHHQLNTI